MIFFNLMILGVLFLVLILWFLLFDWMIPVAPPEPEPERDCPELDALRAEIKERHAAAVEEHWRKVS